MQPGKSTSSNGSQDVDEPFGTNEAERERKRGILDRMWVDGDIHNSPLTGGCGQVQYEVQSDEVRRCG